MTNQKLKFGKTEFGVGYAKTRFWVWELVTRGEGISTPQRPS